MELKIMMMTTMIMAVVAHLHHRANDAQNATAQVNATDAMETVNI